MTISQFIFRVAVLLAIASNSHADPYRDWSAQVSRATKGLEICGNAYWDAIAKRPESEWAKVLPAAEKTCGVMRTNFDTTMLAVRLHVDGMDDILKSYHAMVLEAFDQFKPQRGQNPMEYYVKILETTLAVNRQQLKIKILDGGS